MCGELSRLNNITVIDADALAPVDQHPGYWPRKMGSLMHFNKKLFQLPVSYQHGGMIEIVDTCLWFC